MMCVPMEMNLSKRYTTTITKSIYYKFTPLTLKYFIIDSSFEVECNLIAIS